MPKSFLKSRDQRTLSVARVQAKQIPLGAERIDFAFADQWRDARPGGIADGVGAFVFVFPKHAGRRLRSSKARVRGCGSRRGANGSAGIARVLGQAGGRST